MTNPTPLSSAAQAVLDAYMNNCGWLDGPLEKDYRCTAAVLRAVTDQAEIFFDAYDNPHRVVTVDDLLNIATELEALTND